MQKKYMSWKTKGMNQDISVSAFNPEFSFENMNIRLSTNENNTMMSWVNERGTMPIPATINESPWDSNPQWSPITSMRGKPVGTAVLNHWLVVFTTDGTKDYIYKFKKREGEGYSMDGFLLYGGHLNFSTSSPLETLVSYEADNIQKVYWTDGRNQPRMINIAAPFESLKRKYNNDNGVCSFFDFVPTIGYSDDFSFNVVKNVAGGGLFAPGIIQYCFTYLNRHGQQSNIVKVSPVYYLTYKNRGANPEDKVSCSFKISIEGTDSSFDYVRLYSIQRTSIDSEPFVKLLEDIPIIDSKIQYVDDGTTGSAVTPTELLFLGGREIKALTMAEKDGTLFFGNIEQNNILMSDIQSYFRNDKPNITYTHDKKVSFAYHKGFYSDNFLLDKSNLNDVTTFKGGEIYRFGFQLQKKTGEWLEPVWIGDKTNDKYPRIDHVDSTEASLIQAQATIVMPKDFDLSKYSHIRPLIVFPNIVDRKVLCQGVLNPTVFNAKARKNKSYPFAQASWYYRPFMTGGSTDQSTIVSESTITENVKIITENNDYLVEDPGFDFSPDSTFLNKALLEPVHVLVAEVNENAEDNILKRGYVRGQVTETWQDPQHGIGSYKDSSMQTFYFTGAIKLGSNKYVFIGNSAFGSENTIPDYYGNADGGVYYGHFEYTDGVKNGHAGYTTYMFYTGMDRTEDKHLYYYSQENGMPDEYIFKFAADYTYWKVEFTSIDNSSSYKVITEDNGGNEIAFNHYSSLYTQGDLPTTGYTDLARCVEIQGSVKSFDSVTETEKANTNSNTQFFVDQSIVTLNSPDIEFDTDVQNFSMENLELYIVGVIPITANVSAHKITTSSSMLETNHNIGDAHKFGSGELSNNVLYNNISSNAGKRLVADYLWHDAIVDSDGKKEDGITTRVSPGRFLVFPWQKNGSLNNDVRAQGTGSSWLRTKKESNLLFSLNTRYTGSEYKLDADCQLALTENSEVMNVRLPEQYSTAINYYPNIDTVLYNENETGFLVTQHNSTQSDFGKSSVAVAMKYKSTSHAVLSLKDKKKGTPALLPYDKDSNIGKYTPANTTTFWGSSDHFEQGYASYKALAEQHNYLLLGELHKKSYDASTAFGGDSDNAIMSNVWLVGGDSQPLSQDGNKLIWTVGDTYFQRYDSLKTYAFTNEDTNQIVEILSFMCETRVNLDGRYDRNRGLSDNTTMSPVNFNLLNPVYSQKDNFFTYRKNFVGDEVTKYPNHIAYSLTKTSGADVDLWTNVNLGSILEMDGDKGSIKKLTRFNDQLICFQDSGLSQILYNENIQIATTNNTPIEIANSGKVQGKRYLSNTIGCSNKWSVVNTPAGIYFIDSNDKSIYLFNGQLQNLSQQYGFNTWCKNNIPNVSVEWTPDDFKNIVAYYDRQNQEVLFINNDTALAWSEKLAAFTSFYDYGGAPYFCTLDDEGIWLTKDAHMWQHQKGPYGEFFDVRKPYWMTLVGNPEPQADKTFTNLEFRACVDGDGEYDENTGKFTPALPFDSLEVWNEYQHGIAKLGIRNGHDAMLHHKKDGNNSLKRKFRIWRCDIPRDNADLESDKDMGIFRTVKHPRDRMRNPWLYLKLYKSEAEDDAMLDRSEVHDVGMTYFA